MVAKVAGGIICLGLVGTGGVAIAKPGWFGISNMPSYTKLSEDHDFNKADNSSVSDDYKDKFGETHKDDLVGVVGKTNVTEGKSSVEDWWEWSFERLKKESPQNGKFKYAGEGKAENAVTKPYAKDTTTVTDGNKALNQVCKGAYKESAGNITNSNGDDKYKEDDVWKWCSPGGKKPNKPNA